MYMYRTCMHICNYKIFVLLLKYVYSLSLSLSLFLSLSPSLPPAAQLYADLSQLNLNLPARVCVPLYGMKHQVLRVPSSEAVVLNSKSKVKVCMFTFVTWSLSFSTLKNWGQATCTLYILLLCNTIQSCWFSMWWCGGGGGLFPW